MTPTVTNTTVEVACNGDGHDNELLVYMAEEILKIWLHFVGYKKR
jgi:hypothetical protein